MTQPLRLGTAAGRGALAASALASGMAFLDTTVVNVALPHLGRDLQRRSAVYSGQSPGTC